MDYRPSPYVHTSNTSFVYYANANVLAKDWYACGYAE